MDRSGGSQVPLLTTVLEVLANVTHAEKERKKGRNIGKEEMKKSSFADDYVYKPGKTKGIT